MNSETPIVADFLKRRECGKYDIDGDHYGDDWSHDDIAEIVHLARRLELRNKRLVEALRRFGQHNEQCRCFNANEDCTCGLDAALTDQQEQKP